MEIENLTREELRELAYTILLRELGPSGFVRYINEIHPPSGDWTEERREILAKYSIEDIQRMVTELQEKRKKRDAG